MLKKLLNEASKEESLVLPMLSSRTDASLRKTAFRAIDKAGVERWPRLWHNLRASRQTELEKFFPTHVVCHWLGNSESTARKHYLQVTDDDYSKALQTAVQQRFAGGSIVPQSTIAQSIQIKPVQEFATDRKRVHECIVVREGLEPDVVKGLPCNDLGNSELQRGAKSDALFDATEFAAQIDPALGVVVEAWPTLPPSARMAIETIVQASLVTASREPVEC